MREKLFMFVTLEGVTFSSLESLYPDVDNLQVLGISKGIDEEEAFMRFIKEHSWVLSTKFNEVICIEVKNYVHEGMRFYLEDYRK